VRRGAAVNTHIAEREDTFYQSVVISSHASAAVLSYYTVGYHPEGLAAACRTLLLLLLLIGGMN